MPPFGIFLAGLLVGAAAAALLPRVVPELSRGTRPTLKTAAKIAARAAHSARVAASELSETVEDLYAEAKSELEDERAGAAEESLEEEPPTPAPKPRRPRSRKRAASKAKPA